MADQRTADLIDVAQGRVRITGLPRDRPIHGAKRSAHPANQWLANMLAARRNALQLAQAREWALFYVRGAMAPEFADWGACAREARRLGIQGSTNARDALVKGWEDHRAAEQWANVPQRYVLGMDQERPSDADKVDAAAMGLRELARHMGGVLP